MSSALPPRGLRVLYLPDRLVLQDLSFALSSDPSSRNALVDAANSVHRKQSPTPSAPRNLIDFDLPSPPPVTSAVKNDPRKDSHRYLVFPFASDVDPLNPEPPFEAASPEHAGIPSSAAYSALPADAAAAFLGILPLHSALFVVLAIQARRAGAHPSGTIMSVSKIRLVRLGEALPSKDDKEVASAVTKILEGGSVYYSTSMDLTLRSQRNGRHHSKHTFWWNFPMVDRLPHACKPWAVRTIYGFVGTSVMRFQTPALAAGSAEFTTTLISRRSRHRAGTRYITRGADALGNVANFVETEQLVWAEETSHVYTSFSLIRGSVPVFWRQDNGIAKPSPELDATLLASRSAFTEHFDTLKHMYGRVCSVSLVDLNGSESVLAEAFERQMDLYLRAYGKEKSPKLVAFDFHKHCAGKEYERGLAILLGKIRQDIDSYGFYESDHDLHELQSQDGVFRVNCVDCLDRTNVVQSLIAHEVLSMQIRRVFSRELKTSNNVALRLYSESEDRFKHLWGDNADAISKQYSGTGALKTDFTRTGKRSTTGVIGDGVKSVMRMYYKNFVDESRQEVIDILCGNVILRKPLLGNDEDMPAKAANRDEIDRKSSDSLTSKLWYSFEALRVNAGGDKQPVLIEFYDYLMYVSTPDGICFQYPRDDLVSWSKYEERKTSDKKIPVRLRLMYKPSHSYPCTASPLDLQFKGGTTARENFLRALINWSNPATGLVPPGTPIRARVMQGKKGGEYLMKDWGLAPDPEVKDLMNEIVALVIPETNVSARSNGLAAVPLDVDFSDYVLVGACAVSRRGPALAILVTKRLTASVMTVSEAVTMSSGVFAAGGAAGIALTAGCTSFCFVSANLSGRSQVYSALSSLNLGRQSFDVTNQFHHFILAGQLGDMGWERSVTSHQSQSAGRWSELKDGSFCYTLENRVSVLRNSFPTLRYEDRLHHAKDPGHGFKKSPALILADGVVESRSRPRVTDEITVPVVVLRQLKAEGLRLPLGIEQTSQVNCSIALFCDLATWEGISTKQTTKFSAYVEWKETLRLPMMPSDKNDILESFIIGQILAIAPLGDPIPAGHFVIPISYSVDKEKKFDVPCRLAGVEFGRLRGQISIEKDSERLGMSDAKVATSSSSKRTEVDSSRNSLPPVPHQDRTDELRAYALVQSRQKRAQSAPFAMNLSSSSLSKQKLKMDDMNDKLDAARRKGTKQIKSVVNRLSSLMNQGSNSTSRSSRSGPQPRTEEFWGAEEKPQARDEGWGVSRLRDSASARGEGVSQSTPVVSERDASSKGGDQLFADFDKGFPKASSSSSSRMTHGSPNDSMNAIQHGGDLLLEGLRAEKTGESSLSRGAQVSNAPKHVGDGVDMLLNGLARQKSGKGNSTETGGGDWAQFGNAAGGTGRPREKTKGRGLEQSLLDL
ncbi:hypothetical protein FGB62_95g096 [Gracilaria domingensis]|nr:hypothetical protein FGB62_95g096 [Gracilaria domingensis]